jgi:hypothetical protein
MNYRYHNNLFPNVFSVYPDAVSELKDMLIFAVGGQSAICLAFLDYAEYSK